MELVTTKLFASIAIFVLALLSALIPVKLLPPLDHKETRRSLSKTIARLNCFSGGVFLATCMLDLLPESREAFEDGLEALPASASILKAYPVAEAFVICGVLLILIIEQCTVSCRTNTKSKSLKVAVDSDEYESDQSENDLLYSGADANEHQGNNQSEHLTQSSFRSFALVLALSIHSIFDGLAIGLQPSSSQVMQIAIAIGIHKTIFAFSLGVQFARNSKSLSSTIRYLTCFTLASPVGILLGILFDTVAADFSGRMVLTGLLQGLATGTLMYVTFFEVLPKEFTHKNDRVVKNLCLVMGVAVVIGTLFLSEE
ncbi:zinc transporter ZIP3-like [Amphiura filiformis]|uniref:zinc transporter ZIP3-like n=1 Tax=Amphiura filiformis TaxID=82378 RepID=UPI003B226524